MTEQKWATVYEWLAWAVKNERLNAIDLLLSNIDPESILDAFRWDMLETGYFDTYKYCPGCQQEIRIGDDGVEEASFEDHGRCHSCQQESLMETESETEDDNDN